MASSSGDVKIRLTLENAEVVRQGLQALGKDGAAALASFNNAARSGAASFGSLGSGAEGSTTQVMALMHAVRSAAEMAVQGAPPWRILAMEFNHLAYAASAPGGLIAVLKQVGSSVASMIASGLGRAAALLGPWGLLAAAILAAEGAAAVYFKLIEKDGPTTEDVLKEHKRLVDVIKDAYDKTTQSASNWAKESRNATLVLALKEQIDLQRKLNEVLDAGLKKITTTDWDRPLSGFLQFGTKVKEGFEEFAPAIEQLAASAERGTPAVKEFVDQISAVVLAHPELQAVGADLIKIFSVGDKSALNLANALKQVNEVIQAAKTGAVAPDLLGGGGAGKTSSAYADLKARTQDRIDELNAEAAAGGRVSAATQEMKLKDDLQRAAEKEHIALTPELTAEIDKLAAAYGRASQSVSANKLYGDIQFQREQLSRAAGEQNVASVLRGANIDASSARGEFLAEQIRINQTLETTRSLATDALKGFIEDLREGKSAGEIFGDVLNKIAEKMLDVGVDNFVSTIMGATGASSPGGGLFATVGHMLGFADGGSFMVGGSGGTDSQLVAFRASPNERVTVTRPDQRVSDGGTVVHIGGPTINIAGSADEKTVDLIDARLRAFAAHDLGPEVIRHVREAKSRRVHGV